MDDEGVDPYESLKGESTIIYMMAGGLAGILEHCTMYPLDVVKTRMQSIKPQVAYSTISRTLIQIVATEGIISSLRGMTPVVFGAGPAHALYFACYEHVKRSIPLPPPTAKNHNLTKSMSHGLAGCAATVLHDGIMNPAEVIKQRMQMYKSPFRSSILCAKHIYKTEGFKAFYRSYMTSLTMNLPFQAIHFMTYEFMQDITNPQHIYNPGAHIISGGVAGAFASAITTPFDVCKTLLNTQEKLALVAVKSDRVTGLINALRIVYRCCGFRGYFRGLQARVLFAMPSTAISWSVYEFFKFFLNKEIQKD